MKYITIAYHDGAFPPLGGTAALADASPEELRVLLALIERGRIPTGEVAALARAAGCTLPRAKGAISYWKECGILASAETDGGDPNASPPSSAAETTENSEKIANDGARVSRNAKNGAFSAKESKAPRAVSARKKRILDESPTERTAAEAAAVIRERALADFIDACQQTAGRQFNERELSALLDIEEDFPFSHEFILTLISYSLRRARRFSFRYVRKVAETMLADECLTPEALNARIAAEERFASEEWKLRRLLGIGERNLSARERETLLRWTGTYGFSEEIIGIAYDITVNMTGKASLPYMDKLLTRFREADCKTVADVEDFLEKDRAAHDAKRLSAHSEHTGAPKRGNAKDRSFRTGVSDDDKTATRGTSFDTDDYLSAALRRSYGDDGEA